MREDGYYWVRVCCVHDSCSSHWLIGRYANDDYETGFFLTEIDGSVQEGDGYILEVDEKQILRGKQ